MTVKKPFRRTYRQFADSKGVWPTYVKDKRFASAPLQYIRAFSILQKDLLELFEYIEPSDINSSTYSYRTHELLIRICIEIEANFKAIFSDNDYPTEKLYIQDYRKIETSHRLSSFRIKLPVWHGNFATRQPFLAWQQQNKRLRWYKAYNDSKHSRQDKFDQANFDNVIEAMCGLVAILSSQFHKEDFAPVGYLALQSSNGDGDGFESAIGEYFKVRFPSDWPAADLFDFDWETLKEDPDPFDRLPGLA